MSLAERESSYFVNNKKQWILLSQKGCLSLGHASTFIPSTLAGSCINQDTGEVDDVKLRTNLSLATDAYISRVDGCSCGQASIHLYRGVDTSEHLEVHQELLTFLKGSKLSKESLKQKNPQLYAKFESVWDIRRRHMVHGLPSQYIFMLICCFKPGCSHPLCFKGKPDSIPTWCNERPPITHLPLPFEDEERPWGSSSCSKCSGFCTGHYQMKSVDVTSNSALQLSSLPPSSTLKSEFSKLKDYSPQEELYHQIVKKSLQTPDDTKIWMDHLHSMTLNRRRGAQKAAATRRAKNAQNTQPSGTTSTAHSAILVILWKTEKCTILTLNYPLKRIYT